MTDPNTTDDVPPPGSRAAIDKGCTCPVLDNAHGRGYMGVEGVYVYIVGCKVHSPRGEREAGDE